MLAELRKKPDPSVALSGSSQGHPLALVVPGVTALLIRRVKLGMLHGRQTGR